MNNYSINLIIYSLNNLKPSSNNLQIPSSKRMVIYKYSLAPPVLIHKLNLKTVKEISEHFDLSYEASTYALEYYLKWLNCGYKDFPDYELKMIELFVFTNAETINNINLIENKKA